MIENKQRQIPITNATQRENTMKQISLYILSPPPHLGFYGRYSPNIGKMLTCALRPHVKHTINRKNNTLCENMCPV